MPQDKNTTELKQRLFGLLKKYSYKEGRVVLSSGKVADYYIDARIVTLSSEGAYLTAAIILGLIKACPALDLSGVSAVGGPTLGADPFLGAIAAMAYLDNNPLKTFIVRKAAKEHGSGRRIEGPALTRGEQVLLVDDVATSGKSLIDSIKALKEEGLIVKAAVVIIDRSEGAKEALAGVDCPLISIFKATDFRSQ
ncbi:MAG: orotate phosphoribosyltransferase [Candidatus Omnitrophica bacterium CG11_big_fil_rev_8_21_14_0_20_42_13]|uniref:Orotate phosphoribosyltransferase n=1 Tax=Candidatus Ghiorseimicrobium undicola TaxID=1974746 RepID=A0A2H0LZN3_9BACT|nr:MAG: orotate phosphoribosyltransferase [Candidatus Omnitrophica bacterium CG11_big_fil_rev_8_21_14_0_20_42_13]